MHIANIWKNVLLDFDKKYSNEDMLRIEVSDELYNEWLSDDLKVIYKDGEVILNPDYEASAEARKESFEEAEKERIKQLSLTKREVFLALYADKEVTPEQIEAEITDPAALIEFKYAEKYYRGNPLIDLLGERLGYTSEQLDNLFINGSFE